MLLLLIKLLEMLLLDMIWVKTIQLPNVSLLFGASISASVVRKYKKIFKR
jgi:hypothetical protein